MAERGYTIKRTFDAPPEVVFEAWTDPEQFAIWFGTERARCATSSSTSGRADAGRA